MNSEVSPFPRGAHAGVRPALCRVPRLRLAVGGVLALLTLTMAGATANAWRGSTRPYAPGTRTPENRWPTCRERTTGMPCSTRTARDS